MNLFKVFVGVVFNGVIIYVFNFYFGLILDKVIVEMFGFLKYFYLGDFVFVDKGFLI